MRLSPLDPHVLGFMHALARAYYWAGDYEAAIMTARRLRHSAPDLRQAYTTLMAALGQMGQLDEAQAVLVDALERFGDSFRRWMLLPLTEYQELHPQAREHLIDGFRKAGLIA
jgi:tetratricopeptide (TPR) repeat protein